MARRDSSDETSIERTPTEGRQGLVSGRVSLVLAVSLALALLAVVATLGYVYSTFSPPG